MWSAIHRQVPDAWPQAFRPHGHERLVGVEWRVWAANSPCPPVVVLPGRTSHPGWETVAVLWGWVAVRGTGTHVFTAPQGTVIETDGGMALQLTAEPVTTHVVVAVLEWGADRPQPWRDPIARAVWRDLPILRAAVWSGGAGRHLPGALPWLRDCGDASPPPAEMSGALERLYCKPRQHFLVAADHGVELSDDVVALAADVVQCLAPHAVMLLREGWEGQRHDQTPAALLIARYVELGGSEAVYLNRSETPSMRHWTAHHLLALDMQLTVDPLNRPVVSGAPPQWPHTWDMAVRTMRMVPTGQRAEGPGAEHLLATAQAAEVQQPLLRVPRPGTVGGSGGPQQGHGAHRASAVPRRAARCGAGCPASAPRTLGRGGRPAQRGVARGVPTQEAAVEGPGLLHGVQRVPQGAGPGAQGQRVHCRGHPAGASGLRGGNATAEGPGAGRLACVPEQHVAS